jgi:mono/diheme cytochrome c family protein
MNKLLFSFFLMLSAAVGHASSMADVKAECEGCHFDERERPPATFKSGLGQWNDRNCVGCHAETNEIARNIFEGKTDARYHGLPLGREKLLKLHQHPLSYTKAPKNPIASLNNLARMDQAGILSYVRNPVRSPYFNGPEFGMMSFPGMDAETLGFILKSKGSPVAETGVKVQQAPADTQAGKKLWETQCQSCHRLNESQTAPSGFYLSHLSSAWVWNYGNGKVQHPYKERTMPSLSFQESEAASLVQYLREEKSRAIQALDQEVKAIHVRAQQPEKTLPLKPQAITWLLDKMPRAASCVHCHEGDQRAARKFQATREGIIHYLGQNGSAELLTRLKTRTLEVKAGVVASRAGMPMTLSPLPEPVIQLVETWMSQECPLEDGKKVCARSEAK